MSRFSLLLCASSYSRSSPFKPFLASPFFKKYSQHKGGEEELIHMERAQSTKEVMKKLSEEKEEAERNIEEKSQQGFVSQTSDKVLDADQEAIRQDANPEDVKEKYKEADSGETYHKPRRDGGVRPTTV